MPSITPTNSGRIDPTRISGETSTQGADNATRPRPSLEGNSALQPRNNSAATLERDATGASGSGRVLRVNSDLLRRPEIGAESGRFAGNDIVRRTSSMSHPTLAPIDSPSPRSPSPEHEGAHLLKGKSSDSHATPPPMLALTYPGYGPGETPPPQGGNTVKTPPTSPPRQEPDGTSTSKSEGGPPHVTTPPQSPTKQGTGDTSTLKQEGGQPHVTTTPLPTKSHKAGPDDPLISKPGSGDAHATTSLTSPLKQELDETSFPKHKGPSVEDKGKGPASPSSSDEGVKTTRHKRNLTPHDLDQIMTELMKIPQGPHIASTSSHGGAEKTPVQDKPKTSLPEGSGKPTNVMKNMKRLLSAVIERDSTTPQATLTPQLSSTAERSSGRSLRSVAGALVAGMGSAARAAGIVPSLGVDTGKLKALAGHAIHQTIAVGIPTVIREFIAEGVKVGLNAAPESATFVLQAGMAVANLGAQVMREKLEQRKPEIAAQAYHSMTAAEWETKSPEEQGKLMEQQRARSRLITMMQVASSITNMALTIDAHVRGDKLGAASQVAGEIKTAAYATMRDFTQASFSMVKVEGEMSAGLHGAHHAASAGIYTAMNVGTSTLGDALKGKLVPSLGDATAALTGHPNPSAAMGTAEAIGTVAKAAAISAGMNVIAETTDWFNRTEQQASMTGAKQAWEGPKLTGTDRARVFDQTPGRIALNNVISSSINAVEAMAKHQPAAMQEFLGNATLGVVAGMLDSPIQGLWQAAEAVRGAVKPQDPAVATTDLEMGHVIPSTAVPPNSGVTSPTSTDAGTWTSGRLSNANSRLNSRVHSTIDQRHQS
jgi:hypothetical protein